MRTMYAITLTSLLLLNLFQNANADSILEINPLAGDDRFGKTIRALYDYPSVTNSTWIGIYPKGKDTSLSTTTVLWTSLCGDQVSWNTNCTPETSGDVRFRISAPDQSSNGYDFPLNPGDYKACLMEDRVSPYTEIECSEFNIRGFPSSVASTSSVTPTKKVFVYDETIKADFVATAPIVNSWIGLYPADKINAQTTNLLSRPVNWVYIGCNNQVGNWAVSEYCSTRWATRSVDLNTTTMSVSNEWPPEAGMYKLCLSFFTNPPYEEFACSDDFEVSGFKITVASDTDFGADITVLYENPIHDEESWIGISPSSTDPYKLYKYPAHWANTCGNKKYPCDEVTEGNITFTGADPDQEYAEQWPISPGKKKACLIRNKVAMKCDEFTIADIPSDVVESTTLTISKSLYLDNEPINADFSTPTGIQNTWVGLYKSSSISSTSTLPEKRALWVYSACNNQDGDQSETNNCVDTKTSGTIQIDDTVDVGDKRMRRTRALKKGSKKDLSWPIPADMYKLCFNFYNNAPYSKFVCTEEFEKKYVFELSITSTDIKFGSDIQISWKNPIHDGETYIGIYTSTAYEPKDKDLSLKANTCGDQKKYCSEQDYGTFTFSGADPKQEYNEYWPISPGNKKACMMRFGEVVVCKEFTVKEIPPDYISNSTLTTASSYSRGDTITVKFDTPYGIPNTWIGLYYASDVPLDAVALPNKKYAPLLWKYTGCDNQYGDQQETDNCQAQVASGTIEFDKNSKGYKKGKWPLYAGNYVVYMSLYNNAPYEKFITGDEFTVSD